MANLKISQLPFSPSLGTQDLMEVSSYLNVNSYTSSKATLSQLANFVLLHSGNQFGGVSGSSFSGQPLTYQVILTNPYQDTSYVITVTGEDMRMWSVSNKTPSRFFISSNSNVPLMGYVYWNTN